jgi:hypothetical protein
MFQELNCLVIKHKDSDGKIKHYAIDVKSDGILQDVQNDNFLLTFFIFLPQWQLLEDLMGTVLLRSSIGKK